MKKLLLLMLCSLLAIQGKASVGAHPHNVSLSVGNTKQLTVESSGTEGVAYIFSSLDKAVATVSQDGLITATGEGATYIFVQAYEYTNRYNGEFFVKVTVKNLTIYRQPIDVYANYHEQTILDPNIGVAGGKQPYKYQWQKFWSQYNNWLTTTEGVDGPILTYKYPFETTRYRIIVTDANGDKVTSDEFKLYIFNGDLTGIIDPTSVTINKGESAALTVTGKGGLEPYTYEWFKDHNPITLPITYNATEAGTYRCVVTDAYGNHVVCSNEVTVTVNGSTSIAQSVADDKTVASVKYFAPDGRTTTSAAKGVVIRKTIYTDGTVKMDKVRK